MPPAKKKTNWNEYEQELKTVVKEDIQSSKDPYHELISAMWQAVEKCTPDNTVCPTRRSRKSRRLRDAQRKKRQAKKEYKDALAAEDAKREELKQAYIKCQKETKTIAEEDHAEKVEKTIEALSKNDKLDTNHMWKLKKILTRKNIDRVSTIKDSQGKRLSEPDEIQERYASYYEELYKTREAESDMKSWIQHVESMNKHYRIRRRHENEPYNAAITQKEVA